MNVLFLFLFSMLQTIPFGFTRTKVGRWMQVYVPQRIINAILWVLGFDAPFGGDIDGIPYATDEENPTRLGVDWIFGFHLGAGVLWILFGSLQ